METSFCELKTKEVINIVDGKKLGHIIDLVFETNCAKVLGLVVPSGKSSWNIFKSSDNIFIPYSNICKIGNDCILVELYSQNNKINVLKETTYTTTASVSEPDSLTTK